jgi:FkbH-like protein
MSDHALQPWEIGDLPLHRLLAAGRRVTRESCAHPVRLAVLGDAATQHYCQALAAVLKLRGWWPEIYEAEFDTIRQEVLDPTSGLYAHEPRFVILFTAVQALAGRLANAPDRDDSADEYVRELTTTWDQIRSRLRTTVFQHNLAMPLERPFGNQTSTSVDTVGGAAVRINARLREEATSRGVRLIDMEFQASYFGRRHWFDERLWCHAKQALSPAFLPPLAKSVSDTLLADLGVGVKCVVLDLDNTMWGGILGDDGIDRLELGHTEVGLVFRRFQQALVELRNRGVLLAICSKNDERLVLDVLDNHPDMVLRRDDFVAVVANYDDKVGNILMIRDRLNISLDSLVFFDDSPFERERVRRALPDVQVPDLPEDPAGVLDALARWNLFEGHHATIEDRQRRALYQADNQRQAIREQHENVEEYLADLHMEAEVRPFEPFTLPRVLQLVQRSNQFNLTTIRYSDGELKVMATDRSTHTFSVRLLDRLGDNGVIAAVILRTSGTDMLVDTWIMSCRVLGRRVEELALSLIVDRARACGCRRIVGRYTPTGKNTLVAGLYSRLGFTPAGSDGATHLFALDVVQFSKPDLPIRVGVFVPQEGY